mmetsp:Transcript_9219/g.18675  ORF Transcript_9219/g.18675 Transcript_9219/m.18675 type:complete len:238 (+) Transcript_9219:203-916(+)
MREPTQHLNEVALRRNTPNLQGILWVLQPTSVLLHTYTESLGASVEGGGGEGVADRDPTVNCTLATVQLHKVGVRVEVGSAKVAAEGTHRELHESPVNSPLPAEEGGRGIEVPEVLVAAIQHVQRIVGAVDVVVEGSPGRGLVSRGGTRDAVALDRPPVVGGGEIGTNNILGRAHDHHGSSRRSGRSVAYCVLESGEVPGKFAVGGRTHVQHPHLWICHNGVDGGYLSARFGIVSIF